MTDSTAIDSLPVNNNINVEIKDKPVQSANNTSVNNPQQQESKMNFVPNTLEKNAIDNAINNINNTNSIGMTNLPSRDIPMNTSAIIQDEQVQANYIPNKDKENYIDEKDTYDSMVEQHNKVVQNKDRLDLLYDEIQIPLLVAMLYFIFQLPIVQKKLLLYLPFIFKRDGNLSLAGYITKSSLFGIILYLLIKITKYLSEL